MGRTVEAKASPRQTQERKWVLDRDTGKIMPDEEPADEPQIVPQPKPAPIQAAFQTYD
jgi:hypothetical protein